MSQIDDDLIGTRYRGRDAVTAFNEQMAQEIGSITSRDQIIDPYSLVNMANYRKTRAGLAQYNSDLQQAQQYAERQEAAYLEWYNSPEQQAIRDREAGLNPNILGLSGSEGVDTQQNPNSPVAGMQTNGQLAVEGINTFMQVLETAASVGSFAASVPNIGKQGKLLDAQIDAQNLANVSAFEQTAHNAIASNFATFHAAATAAGDAVDVAKYFADDKNFEDIIPSYAPSDSPMYRNALARVRKGSESILADAYSTNSAAASSQQSFARLLANPYSNPNTVIMASFLEPMMKAVFDMEKLEADFRSDAAKFKSQAMSGIDSTALGEVWSESQSAELRSKKLQNIIDSAMSTVYDNLKKTYMNDPNGPTGISAAAMILGHFDTTVQSALIRFVQGLLNTGSSSPVVSSPDTSGDLMDNEAIVNFNGRPRVIRDE